ncbi:MAG: hypothetical protein JXR41_10640, partial [Bacteroidales bacterium]|nr:hypothetical protein [Bacteroidales bacterium]
EITLSSPGKKTEMIMEMLFIQLEKYGMELTDLRIINAQYLKQYNIIAQHYGIINAVSASPLKNMTDESKERFADLTGKSIKEVMVLGSLEIFRYFPDFNASSLDYLWQNAKTEKLAGGTYVAKVVIDGKEIYLINGFHPRQLEHYVRPGRCIITMALSGDLSWKEARNAFIGATNPESALPGSLRNMLLQNRELFGLPSVSSSWNGFHLSAGPVEGLVELMRYTSDFSKDEYRLFTDFHFGKMLAARFNNATIKKITDNTMIDTGGKKTSVFDLTEEKNSDEALALLERYFAG